MIRRINQFPFTQQGPWFIFLVVSAIFITSCDPKPINQPAEFPTHLAGNWISAELLQSLQFAKSVTQSSKVDPVAIAIYFNDDSYIYNEFGFTDHRSYRAHTQHAVGNEVKIALRNVQGLGAEEALRKLEFQADASWGTILIGEAGTTKKFIRMVGTDVGEVIANSLLVGDWESPANTKFKYSITSGKAKWASRYGGLFPFDYSVALDALVRSDCDTIFVSPFFPYGEEIAGSEANHANKKRIGFRRHDDKLDFFFTRWDKSTSPPRIRCIQPPFLHLVRRDSGEPPRPNTGSTGRQR